MMDAVNNTSIQSPVHLVLGDEEFLAERAKAVIISGVRTGASNGEDIVVTTLRAGDITESELIEVLSPSLFAEDRIVVVEQTHDAGKEPMRLLIEAAYDPAPGITLIIMHSGGGRTKGSVEKLKKIAQVHPVAKLKANERPQWVSNEFRRHKVRVGQDVVSTLLEGVGSDLRELASAVAQLVADTGGNVTTAAVREYYVGVAEVSGFDIADLACAGQVESALASTRRAIQLGISPVALAAALSKKVSAIARLYSLGRVSGAQFAGKLEMPPFAVEKTAQVARRWSGENVSRAVILMAELDAAVKGQSGGDDGFALERAVVEIARLAR